MDKAESYDTQRREVGDVHRHTDAGEEGEGGVRGVERSGEEERRGEEGF